MKIMKTNYSKIAEYYDKVRHVRADVWIPKIIQYGKIQNGSLVLDVGCGTGSFAISLLSLRNAIVFGVDSSFKMLKNALAKNKARKIHWILLQGRFQ